MPSKDYYQILELDPGADQSTIKKAFRRLAMKYHPDRSLKLQDDGGIFRYVNEAYEVLSDPSKREQYHYERWLDRSMEKKMQGYLSAYQIYQVILESEKYISGIDQFRMNDYTLLSMLLNLFSTYRIQTIIDERNTDLEINIITIAMKMAEGLKSDCQIQFKERMNLLAFANPAVNARWEKNINNKITSERKSIYAVPVLFMIAIALCLLFYFLGK